MLAEGSSWRDYNWLLVLIILPFGILIYGYWWLINWTCRKSSKVLEGIPDNAIIYTFHKDMHTCIANNCLFRKSDNNLVWLGYHGLLSYAFSIPYFSIRPYRTFRYKLNSGPLGQITDFLNNNPTSRILVFTDAGGPYNAVRITLLQLALKTGRPLIALRQKASKSFTFLQHIFPLPFCTIKTVFSQPIDPKELQKLSRKEAINTLQTQISNL